MSFLDRFLRWALPSCRRTRKAAAVAREDYRKTIEELKTLTAPLDDTYPGPRSTGHGHASTR